MADNSTFSPSSLPNPFTPMAFLPPDLAFEVTVSAYIVIGGCAVLVWDILNNLKNDYKILFKYRIIFPTIAYFTSRLSSLGFVLGTTIFETAPTGNCIHFEKGLATMYLVAVGSTSLLFFFRVRAIFDKNPYVTAFFGFMWLAVVAGCATSTTGVVPMFIGPTQYCMGRSVANYVAAAAIIPLVNDTLIFLAISWRLMKNSYVGSSLRKSVLEGLHGKYMPAFSRGLLHDGQLYYLTTVSSSLLTVIMIFVPGVPAVYRSMFTIPNIAIMNIMACRVFRNTKFGIFRKTYGTNTSGLNSTQNTGTANDLLIPSRRSEICASDDNPHRNSNRVEVTNTVESRDNINPGNVAM